jgi:hypothetical protein
MGIDPLYLDDSATVKYATYDFATLTNAPGAAATEVTGKYYTDEGVLLNDGTAKGGRGHWAIKFFDAHGEDWITSPIQAGASCTSVIAALEALPNNVVPHGTTYCTRSWNINAFDNDWTTTGGLCLWRDLVRRSTSVKFGSPLQDQLPHVHLGCLCRQRVL